MTANPNTSFKKGTKLECLVCDNVLDIHSQYPAQPASRYALELYCPACKVISIYNFTTPVTLLQSHIK